MKVYVKKGECQSPIPGILATAFFLAFSIGIFASCFSYGSLMEAVLNDGMGLLFALVFFSFGLFFLYELFKKPKGFSARLIKKSIEDYKGRQITYMSFYANKEKVEDYIPITYNCYTYGNNDLVENENYIIKIKEFNWQVKAVEEDNDLGNNVSQLPNITLNPVLLAVGFIFGRNGIF